MPNFEHLECLVVEDADTSEFRLPELGPRAVVGLAFAGPLNKDYWAERWAPMMLKGAESIEKSGAKTREEARKAVLKTLAEDPDTLLAARMLDLKLFPKYIIRWWRGIYEGLCYTCREERGTCECRCCDEMPEEASATDCGKCGAVLTTFVECECTPEAAEALLVQLHKHPSTRETFERMRDHAARIENFRQLPRIPKEQSGN